MEDLVLKSFILESVSKDSVMSVTCRCLVGINFPQIFDDESAVEHVVADNSGLSVCPGFNVTNCKLQMSMIAVPDDGHFTISGETSVCVFSTEASG